MAREQTDLSRRTVLELTGASLATLAGSGVASADHEHPDVENVRMFPIPGGSAEFTGDVTEFGQGASSVDVWVEWGEIHDGLVNQTETQTLDSPGSFSVTDYGFEEYNKYEFRAVARDSDDGDLGYSGTYSQTYKTQK